MATRRISNENITGYGVSQVPAIPVPSVITESSQPNSTTTPTPAVPVQGAGGNPIPIPGGANGDARSFVQNFQFQNAQPGTAQDAFNKIKQRYGHNAAWSWAMQNWNQLGGYDPSTGLRGAMYAAGLDGTNMNRVINTYGSSRSNDVGDGFGWESGGLFGADGYNKYANSIWDRNSPMAAQQLQTNTSNFQNQMANGGYGYQGTNTWTAPSSPSTAVGINPSTGQPYGQPGNVHIGANSQPVVGAPAPAVPAPAADPSGWNNWGAKVQARTPRGSSLSSTSPFGIQFNQE